MRQLLQREKAHAHTAITSSQYGRGVVLAASPSADGNSKLNSQFGGILVERGRLDPGSLEQALRLQQAEPGTRIGELLLRLGVVTALDIAQTLAAQLGLTLMAAADYPEFPLLEERVATRFLRETHTLPVAEDEAGVVIAMVDPTDAIRTIAEINGDISRVRVTIISLPISEACPKFFISIPVCSERIMPVKSATTLTTIKLLTPATYI